MAYFNDVLTAEQLKSVYRRLAMLYHPDKGGNLGVMQKINVEYSLLSREIEKVPKSLAEIKVGNTIFVNKSKCIVTHVDKHCFKAKSLETKRETFFSKTTGFAMLNFRYKASICPN